MMEKETKSSKKRHFLKLTLTAAFIFLTMYLCAVSGYRFVRNGAKEEPTESRKPESVTIVVPQEEDPLLVPETNLASASLPQQNISIPSDPNDYLVLSEDGTVNLYFITENGNRIFSKALPISPDSLLDEDKAQLEEGIILATEEELAALLEDYTS